MREHSGVARRIATRVVASDPVTRAGLVAQLRTQHELVVVEDEDRAAVAVVATDVIDDEAARIVRTLLRSGPVHVVVVSSVLDDSGVLVAVEAGACAIVRRADASAERMASVIGSAVAGHGTLPPDLLGSLLSQVGQLQRNVLHPRGIQLNGFSERETEVLRLIADGFDTAEIAAKLSYSERTVKNIVHDVMSRFNLRNRCHAVAYALRSGVI